MRYIKLSMFFICIIGLLITGCSEESPFVPEYHSPADNMVLVTGGEYTMGDWLPPYMLSDPVSEGLNIKDISSTADHGLDFTFDSRHLHDVTVHDFMINKYEVTFDEFDRFCYEMNGELHFDGFDGDDEYAPVSWGRGDQAAIYITWMDAIEYCNWLSVKEGLEECYEITGATSVIWYEDKNGYRLPTEAEWEYAARACPGIDDQGNLYAGCDDEPASMVDSVEYIDEHGIVWDYTHTDEYTNVNQMEGQFETLKQYGWFMLNSGWVDKDDSGVDNGKSSEIGMKLPNELGLYDMSGNVWEWCWDFYSPHYYTAFHPYNAFGDLGDEFSIDPIGPTKAGDLGATTSHVLRGGSWGNYPVFLRSTFRFFSRRQVLMNAVNPSFMYSSWRSGFRICRNAE